MKNYLTRLLKRNKEMVSVNEAAKIAGVSNKTIYHWGYIGKLTRFFDQSNVRVDVDEIEKAIKK